MQPEEKTLIQSIIDRNIKFKFSSSYSDENDLEEETPCGCHSGCYDDLKVAESPTRRLSWLIYRSSQLPDSDPQKKKIDKEIDKMRHERIMEFLNKPYRED